MGFKPFKNCTLFIARHPDGLSFAAPAIPEHTFKPCGGFDAQSAGFIPPRGDDHEQLIEFSEDHRLMLLRIDTKKAPPSAIDEGVRECSKAFHEEMGRKPGRRDLAEMKEAVKDELIQRAIPARKDVGALINTKTGILAIDATGATADLVVTKLVHAWPGVVIAPLQTTRSVPALLYNLMEHGGVGWLTTGRACKLEDPDEKGSSIAYADQLLDTDEIKAHMRAGLVPTMVEIWYGDSGCQLLEGPSLRKIDLAAVDGAEHDADGFDGSLLLFSKQIAELIGVLVNELGGLSA